MPNSWLYTVATVLYEIAFSIVAFSPQRQIESSFLSQDHDAPIRDSCRRLRIRGSMKQVVLPQNVAVGHFLEGNYVVLELLACRIFFSRN